MRILHVERLTTSATKYVDAAAPLAAWLTTVHGAQWKNLMEVRQTYRHADAVKLDSGKIVTIFNIKGNHYRLITAIEYPIRVVNIMAFLTHAEYSKDRWKDLL